jgi:hypothetical protein
MLQLNQHLLLRGKLRRAFRKVSVEQRLCVCVCCHGDDFIYLAYLVERTPHVEIVTVRGWFCGRVSG